MILSEAANRIFLAESGRKILSALIVKARKVNYSLHKFCFHWVYVRLNNKIRGAGEVAQQVKVLVTKVTT